MSKLSKVNYVTASRPVNRRTHSAPAPAPAPLAPSVQERLSATQARRRFGAPLAQQLGGVEAALTPPQALSGWTVAGGVLSAVSAVALLLAGIQRSALGAAAGALVGCVGLALLVWQRRARQLTSNEHVTPALVLFDTASLQAFDRLLHQLAPELPDALVLELSTIKQQLVRLARLAASVGVNEHFTAEHRFYLGECVRRYVPDSLQSYLQVPRAQRSVALAYGDDTAVSLLSSQLGLLRLELDKIELQLTQSSAEALRQQQRFLQAKASD